MQNSELFRRGIVLPLDDEAEECLRVGSVDESIAVKYLEIPSDGIFNYLWDLRLFEMINLKAGSLIDAYDEELLEPHKCLFIIDAITDIRKKEVGILPLVKQFLVSLEDIAKQALELNRPVLFVL